MAPSLLPPSEAHIWGPYNGCSGWAIQYMALPEQPETEAKRNAVLARNLSLTMIRSYARGGLDFPILKDHDPGIYSAARIFAEDVKKIMQETRIFGGDFLKIDEYVSCPSISEHTNGHIDCAIYDKSRMMMWIWLFKNGHTPVEAVDNLRGVCYASGLFDKWEIDGAKDQRLHVSFRVVQPNAHLREGPISQWSFKGYEMRGMVNILCDSARRALGSRAKCQTGPYCPTCNARYNCDAAFGSGLTMFEAACAPMMDELTPDDLAQRYALVKKALTLIKSLDTAYTQQVESRLRSGRPVPGFVANPKYGRLDWNVPVSEVASLGDLIFGMSLTKQVPVTPTQAINELGADEATVMMYASKKQSGWEILPETKITSIAKEHFA